jgi:glycosyltransferase involved in cell wall biosynthesis
MSRPLISIIVPVFNAQHFLGSCLKSISLQTYKEWECICVDDESNDNSFDVINKTIKSDSRFRTIRQPNSGPGIARNTGLTNARGDFFTFIDADDLVHPKMLYRLFHLAKYYNADLSVCSFKRFISDDEFFSASINCDYHEENLELFLAPLLPKMKEWQKFRVHPFGKLYRTDVHSGLRFPNLRGSEDAYASIDVYAISKRAVFSNEKLYGYRLVPTGLTQSKAKYRIYILGDSEVATHCLKVFSVHGIADSVAKRVAYPYLMRIYHYVNEMAIETHLSKADKIDLMRFACKGINDIKSHTGRQYWVVPPIHYLTYFALRFRLLWLLTFRFHLKRFLKLFIPEKFSKLYQQNQPHGHQY